MNRRFRFLLLAFTFFLFPPPQKTRAQDKEEILVLKVDGRLAKDDPKDRVLKNSHHKAHTVKLQAGLYYRIDLVSPDFDAFLRLEDSTGKELAKDDDSDGGTNARIIFLPDKEDAYRIIATSQNRGQPDSLTPMQNLLTQVENVARHLFHCHWDYQFATRVNSGCGAAFRKSVTPRIS